MRITLVEDNASLAKGICYRLEDAGHAVDMLDNGTVAAQFLADDDQADLIILDINLPGIDGLTLLKDMRRRAHAPVELRPLGGLLYDPNARQLIADGVDIALPRREMAVFECLADADGRLVSKSAMLDHVYGVGADVEDTVLEVYISRLRRRLRDYGIQIKTQRSLGYQLSVGPPK